MSIPLAIPYIRDVKEPIFFSSGSVLVLLVPRFGSVRVLRKFHNYSSGSVRVLQCDGLSSVQVRVLGSIFSNFPLNFYNIVLERPIA
jgi:hypothetical protein